MSQGTIARALLSSYPKSWEGKGKTQDLGRQEVASDVRE